MGFPKKTFFISSFLKTRARIILDKFKFEHILNGFDEAHKNMPSDSVEAIELANFIQNITLARDTWLKNPKEGKTFIGTCLAQATKAQNGSLKNYSENTCALFKKFIGLINWLTSFIMSKPIIKTDMYNKFSIFKETVTKMDQEVVSSEQQSLPQ